VDLIRLEAHAASGNESSRHSYRAVWEAKKAEYLNEKNGAKTNQTPNNNNENNK